MRSEPSIALIASDRSALWRRFSHAPKDTRVGEGRDGLLGPNHLNPMIPIVSEIEPVIKNTIRLQTRVVQLYGACVSMLGFPWWGIGNPVGGPVAQTIRCRFRFTSVECRTNTCMDFRGGNAEMAAGFPSGMQI